jgi:hypothetical protein
MCSEIRAAALAVPIRTAVPQCRSRGKKSKDVYQGRLRSEGYGTITTEIVKGQARTLAEYS